LSIEFARTFQPLSGELNRSGWWMPLSVFVRTL